MTRRRLIRSAVPGTILCAIVTAVLLAAFFVDHDQGYRWPLLIAAALFGIPAVLGLLDLLFGKALTPARDRWVSVIGGIWLALFGGLCVYGAIAGDQVRGGLPFLSAAANQLLARGFFLAIGLGLIWLGFQLARKGLAGTSPRPGAAP